MDKRLLLEFLPAIVFLLTNAAAGLYAAAAAAIVAALVAVALRYRIDGQLPFLALATVALSLALLIAGFLADDERFIKIRPTVSGIGFAVILAVGSMFRPSLLQRSMGYKLILTDTGWKVLHFGWMSLALTFALMNELVWRNTSTDTWVLYGTIIGPAAFAMYYGLTWWIAWEFWDEDEEA